jgi:hypothetical protein
VCGPTALTGLVALALGATTPAAEVVSWALGIPVLVVALWLLLRLRPAPFAVTAGFVLLFVVLLPTAFFYAAFGLPKTGSTANSATAARATATPPQSGSPVPLPPGSRERKYSIARPGERAIAPGTESRPERNINDIEAEKRQLAEQRLRKIWNAIRDYLGPHANQYPDGLRDLVAAGLITPEDTAEDLGVYHIGISKQLPYPAPAKWILLRIEARDYPRITALFGDGRVESYTREQWPKVQMESDDAARELARRSRR